MVAPVVVPTRGDRLRRLFIHGWLTLEEYELLLEDARLYGWHDVALGEPYAPEFRHPELISVWLHLAV